MVADATQHELAMFDDKARGDGQEGANACGIHRFDTRQIDDDVQISIQDALVNDVFEFFDVGRFDSAFWQKNEDRPVLPLYGLYRQSVIRDWTMTSLCTQCAPEFARMHDRKVYLGSRDRVRHPR